MSRLLSRLRRSFKSALPVVALTGLAASATVTGCSEVGTDTENVTDIQHSDVKDQSIGNCWVYAAIGWAESLHLRYTSQEVNISESYITYWHWFEQITGGAPGEYGIVDRNDGDELTTGGWWGVAGEIMLRYGMMHEGGFIPTDAEKATSYRQSSAKKAINASLKSGVLSDPANRRNPAIVRAELNKAWELDEDVVALLDATFGEGVDRNMYNTPPTDDGRIFLASNLAVGHVQNADGSLKTVTLHDAIGRPKSNWDMRTRVGEFSWDTNYYPRSESARRSFQVKLQNAMHHSQPALLSWLVDFNAMKGSDFLAPPESPGRQGGHLVVVYDYQISNVPGFGTLEAGTLVTDQAALDAALAPEAEIDFIRIKNSWGSSLAPDNISELKGYHDLHMDYLDGPITKCKEKDGDKCGIKSDATPLRKAILPGDRFIEAASGTCAASLYEANCSGNTLQWCDNGVLERFDCTQADWTCGFSEDLGEVDCLLDEATP